jgi:hypothetical protein
MTYVSSFDATTASFSASWTHNYSQSKTAFDPVLPEGAFGYTIVLFTLDTAAQISATWTCDGQFTTAEQEPSTRLIFEGQEVFANTPGQTTGCSFEGTLEPGEYRFQAFTGLSLGGNFDKNRLTEARTHGYSVTFTFPEAPPPGP